MIAEEEAEGGYFDYCFDGEEEDEGDADVVEDLVVSRHLMNNTISTLRLIRTPIITLKVKQTHTHRIHHNAQRDCPVEPLILDEEDEGAASG